MTQVPQKGKVIQKFFPMCEIVCMLNNSIIVLNHISKCEYVV